jgi:methionine biosynthesis protein MetW
MDYEEYWNKRVPDIVMPRFRLIARQIARGSSVADIGCGDGSLLRFLARERETRGWGTDVSAAGVALATERGTDATVGDITDPEFQIAGPFDYIVISEVLEHIAEPEEVLKRLRPSVGRAMIVTLPNTGYIEHRLRLLFGRFPVQWMFHPGEHLRFWTLADFKDTAAVTGYRVTVVLPALGWFPFARLLPSLFASQIVYVLEPAVGS